MPIRPFRPEDAPALARLSASCSRGEADFVLNPLWEEEGELFAEFDRHGISIEQHLLVADVGESEVVGMSGFLRSGLSAAGGLISPVVSRTERGRGVGGELLRAALDLGKNQLGLSLAVAGIGTRNRAGYALLTAHGFRPVRQHFFMRCDERPTLERPPIEKLELDHATPSDLSAVLEIYLTCGFAARTPDTMREIFEDGRHLLAVARHDGKVVAFTELETHWPKRNWVAFVGVSTELRSQGVGSSLVAWAVAQQFDAGLESAQLLLSPANRTAVRAYEKVGFRRHRTVDVLERPL